MSALTVQQYIPVHGTRGGGEAGGENGLHAVYTNSQLCTVIYCILTPNFRAVDVHVSASHVDLGTSACSIGTGVLCAAGDNLRDSADVTVDTCERKQGKS